MTIACLHTAASNIAIFDDAAQSLGIPPQQISHLVMPHLLAEAELSGGMTPAQQQRLQQLLLSLTPWFDAILITCSTLGAAADSLRDPQQRCAVYRTDRMLADEVHRRGAPALVLCAAESTLHSTRQLFCPESLAPDQRPQVRLIPDAWAAFKAGRLDDYYTLIADAVAQGQQQGAVQVALAQVSMAGAASRFPAPQRPLTSPHLALSFVLQQAKGADEGHSKPLI
ncbi:glutamate racemase [Pantoea sp. R102]|uniref:glutamate racemase n=1 Tax=Pantoea sp. R102 TaxID=2507583 RepID=UPI0010A8BB02|nr:glutamate racemase [Pantoea sp. R102]THD34573.1 glutamate racemase [Pantoea sp. R102]